MDVVHQKDPVAQRGEAVGHLAAIESAATLAGSALEALEDAGLVTLGLQPAQ